MIFITGDTHGTRDIYKFSTPYFQEVINKPENTLVVTGDFGAIWSNKTMYQSLAYYSELKVGKILFVDGNNENFDILNTFPESTWNGGKVHQINDKIIHLMRGQVFDIEGIKFFTLGGADSCDAADFNHPYTSRVRGESWWEEESVSEEEFMESIKNLAKHDFKVDVILTHDTTNANVKRFFPYALPGQSGVTMSYLDKINKMVDYKQWFFGHHHRDLKCSPTDFCVFQKFVDLSEMEDLPFKSEIWGIPSPSEKSKQIYSKFLPKFESTTPKDNQPPKDIKPVEDVRPVETPDTDPNNM